ncbi:50S ribosomal protein L24 [Limihaloglobus sulfuriphilus]|uniref:Large ribosomal subunit protein uL24 n=1 Tax=Limihaloglobus sulfuriphilus TaxID=1851148 RepID=A0A1Q2MH62_9BACT|nr:50S ribosomal protein L24 [Limihaloglobus sulfuriphilus]AQQ72045.1 50S ribosomal protein L24 [Limihaloglobus sulfuriphilus]
MARHIRKNDTVQVITGDDKGKTGKVIEVLDDGRRCVVAGVNIVTKHVRPSQRYPQGGQIHVEQPLHVSNVLPVNPKTGKGTRVKIKFTDNGEKQRVASDGTVIGTLKKAVKK